jgi:hypothetical protein
MSAGDTPSGSPPAEDAVQELKITWPRVVSVMWLLTWRGLLGTAMMWGIERGFSHAGDIARISSVPLAVAAGFIWQAIVVRTALKKKYRGFRIVLVSPN